jgi:hypothetical protein
MQGRDIAVRERVESILLGILIASLGVWQAITGLGPFHVTGKMKDPGMAASGMMFFFAGALSFYNGTTGSAGQNTPVSRWTNYLMTLLILMGFDFIFFWTGADERNFIFVFLGFLTSTAVLWFAITRRPEKEESQ